MGIAPLPPGWDITRGTLQRYSHALTAFPRAGAPQQPRWHHVAMEPTDRGLRAAPTPLADGTELTSEIDLVDHRIVARAGDDEVTIALGEGKSPVAVAEAIGELAERHGSIFDIDPDRVNDTTDQTYDPAHGSAFLVAARAAVEAMTALNAGLDGEVAGPHLWPHGFDIATEWYSERTVDYDGGDANAQIAMGWYPIEDAYLYVNPWPFEDSFAEQDLPGGASWHRSTWEGAKRDVTSEISVADATALARRIHDIAADSLR